MLRERKLLFFIKIEKKKKNIFRFRIEIYEDAWQERQRVWKIWDSNMFVRKFAAIYCRFFKICLFIFRRILKKRFRVEVEKIQKIESHSIEEDEFLIPHEEISGDFRLWISMGGICKVHTWIVIDVTLLNSQENATVSFILPMHSLFHPYMAYIVLCRGKKKI